MQDSIETSTTITAALRQAADLLDQHPDLPVPYIVAGSWCEVELNWFVHLDHKDTATQKGVAAGIVRALGGDWTKVPGAVDSFMFKRSVGPLRLNVQVDRPAVCERVVTGVETVTIPAKAAEPERVEEREIVEWRCQPLLADADTEQVPA